MIFSERIPDTMKCRFEKSFEINSHDCDLNNVLRPSGYLKYLQECANLHVNHIGFGYDDCLSSGRAFVISRLSLTVEQPIFAYDRITASTSALESSGVSYNRASELTKGGKTAASLSTVWALIDIHDRHLIRVSESGLSIPVGAPLSHTAPLKFRIPSSLTLENAGEFKVSYSVCDRNRHMNNTRYPDMYCDLIPDLSGKVLHELSICYYGEAPLGETLSLYMAEEDGVYYFRAVRTSDGKCANEARMTFYPLC